MEGRKHLATFRVGRARTVCAALAIACLSSAAVQAQSTTAMIHGHAPAGETIVVTGAAGVHRTMVVRKNGTFRLGNLPLGVYQVMLKKDDKIIDMYHRVPLLAGGGVEVDFACPKDHCAAP